MVCQKSQILKTLSPLMNDHMSIFCLVWRPLNKIPTGVCRLDLFFNLIRMLQLSLNGIVSLWSICYDYVAWWFYMFTSSITSFLLFFFVGHYMTILFLFFFFFVQICCKYFWFRIFSFNMYFFCLWFLWYDCTYAD